MKQAKNIVLGISGGIAAYKCAELVRRLKERNCNVKVVMTDSAKHFITPLTMQAVSGEPVSDSLLDPSAEAAMGHIELAKWADLVLLAPATADLIARMAAGMGNDLLTTLILATDAPVAVSPAMNQQMYRNIEDPLPLDDLVSDAGVSRRQMERLFQKHLGESPSSIYRDIRLERARSLLVETDRSVAEVAAATGFNSVGAFSKHYKTRYGTTPYGTRRNSQN